MQENESSIPSETVLSPVMGVDPASGPDRTATSSAPVKPQPVGWQPIPSDGIGLGTDRQPIGWVLVESTGEITTRLTRVLKEELLAFERAAHVNGKDLLRGKKLKARLDAVVALRALPQLVLVDWADGPVFGPPSQIAPPAAPPADEPVRGLGASAGDLTP